MADELRQPLDDRREEVGPVVRVDPLHHRRDALQPHAGVDRLERQRRQRPVRGAIELHEDQVPDLEPARAVLRVVRDAVLALGQLGAAVVVQLAARPARAGVAHAPEVLVVALRDVAPAHQPLRRQADLIGPDAVGLLVIGVDRGGHSLGRQAELLGQVLPRPVDGVALEVVAEAPVAEHLEQGLVARRAADLLEVVVLAGHPQAGLRVHRAHVVALLLAGQHALEVRHPGVDEQQGGIVARQQRRRRHAGMPALLEEALVALADLRCRHRLQRFTSSPGPSHHKSRLPPALRLRGCGGSA